MKRVLSMCAAVAVLSACESEPTGANCDAINPGDLVITEVMIDPEGADTGNEWFEIFNALGSPVELKGLTLFTQAVDGTGVKSHPVRAGTLPARGYFTVGDVRSGPNPAWIGYSYNTALGSFPNSTGVVGVRCGQKVITSFTWTVAGKAGRSRQLNGNQEPSADRANIEANYCDAPTTGVPYSGGNQGTPGTVNATCTETPVTMPGTCLENGVPRSIVSPVAGDLVISEVHGKPSATSAANGEWVELNARNSFDLNDLVIVTTSGSSKTITAGECISVQTGDYAVLARNGDETVNGGITPRFVYGTLAISDTGAQSITVTLADAGLIDIANFNAPITGRSWQLDPMKFDGVSNDDASSFCRAQTQWVAGVGDYGTPGSANEACPADAGTTDPDVCFDDATQAERGIRQPGDGELVFTEWMTAPSTPQADREYVEAVAKADFDLNGVTLVVRGSSTGRRAFASQSCVPVTNGQYLLFARNEDPTVNGGLPAPAATLPNTPSLTATSSFDFVRTDGGIIDSAAVNGFEVSKHAIQVAPGFENATDNDLAENRCASPTQWVAGTGDFGSPGVANPACPVDAGQPDTSVCFDEGAQTMRSVTPAPDGDLVITEWMTGPSTPPGAQGEYFEVLAKSSFDLNGLSFRINTGALVPFTSGNTCRTVPADSYLVFGRNADAAVNGNLPMLTASFATNLTGTSSITLLNADGGVHDSIAADGETSGASRQVRPDALTVTDNDDAGARCITGTGIFYGATTDDGGVSHTNRGTPGQPNICP